MLTSIHHYDTNNGRKEGGWERMREGRGEDKYDSMHSNSFKQSQIHKQKQLNKDAHNHTHTRHTPLA